MITLSDISKTYFMGGTSIKALAHVNLAISAGEYIALVGPSGSGKSTLLHIMGCLDRPSEGTYRLDNVAVEKLCVNDLAEIRNRRIGFIFQSFNLMPRLSAWENVALPMRYAGRGYQERHERAVRLLERVGLAERLHHRPGEMSGGQQQRVAIARALVNDPSVILADEPTGNLDSHSGAEIVRLLEELSKEGKLVIIVTHDMELAKKAQRIVRLFDGNIIL